MTTAEAPSYLHPVPGIEENLCRLLSEQEIPIISLSTVDHETRISAADVEWSITKPEDESLIKDWRPLVIENGLCATEESYKSLAANLASLGYIVLTKKPPRHQRADVAYSPHNLTHPMELQSKATWAVMRDYMRLYPVEDRDAVQQFHLICHSMGGPVGSDVAEHHLKHIASLILIGSAGLEKHHTFEMAKRFITSARKEIAPAILLPGRIANTKLAIASVKHIAGVLNRTGREALQVSNHYTVPALERLIQLNLDLYNIQPENDRLFPYAKQLGAAALFRRFVRFNIGKADHLAPQTQGDLVAAIIDDFIQKPDFTLPTAA